MAAAEGGGGGEGGEGGGGLGTHWKPLNTFKIRKPEPRATRWGQWQRLRAVGAVRARRGFGHTLERLESPNQGGQWLRAVSGGGSEGDGGDDVEWLGEALRAVGVDEALRAVWGR